MKVIYTLLLLLLTSYSFSQQNFLINEGSPGSNEEFYHSAQTKDGNLVAVGYTDVNDPNYDMLLFKVDLNGQRLWTKTISGGGYDEAYGIVATSDGGFAVSGSIHDKMALLKFDAAGNLQWNKEYSELNGSDGSRLLQTTDGGFLIPGGATKDGNFNTSQSYLVKTDASGNVEWSKSYFTSSSFSLIYDIKKTADNNYAFLANNTGDDNDTTCVVKINLSGDVLWAKYFFDPSKRTDGYSLVITPDNGFLVSGTNQGGKKNGFFFKLNNLGTKVWAKSTNTGDVADLGFYTCVVGTNGGYAFMGSGTNADSNFYYLVKINNQGELTWTKTIKKAMNDQYGTYYSVINTKEGGYLITGSVRDASGLLDGALQKFDVNFSNCRPSTGILGTLIDYGTLATASITAVAGNTVVTTETPSVTATTKYTLVCTALPLNLISFTAAPQNNKVQLQWKTSQEINTSHFDVEKSHDGKGFVAFKQLSAAGSSGSILTYNTTDDQPYQGKSWYRLKMVDNDGEYAYSNAVPVNFSIQKNISINPNPVNNALNLYVQSTIATNANIEIVYMNGKLLLQKKTVISTGSNLVSFDVSHFAKGSYIIKIEQGKDVNNLKWVKQ